jgi:hypothetical protein
MPSKFVLEDGSGFYTLEDGTGVYLLELDDPAGGFRSPVILWPFGFGAPAAGGGGTVVNIFSGRGGGAASPLVG